MEQFAYVASHDLRAPLNAMRNLADWIKEDMEAGIYTDKTRNYIDTLKGRVRRMDRLLNDLLQYSRIGREDATPENIHINEKVLDVFGTFNVDGRHILEMTGDEVWVRDYDVTYEILLGNLIGNAFKHNDKERTQINIHIERSKNGLKLSVGDNGPGIADRDKERVFEVFSTLQRRDEVEASGMGLALVKKIVSQKNGRIDITESSLGGAQFNIVLEIPTFMARPQAA